MRKIYLLLLLVTSFSFSQSKLLFEYDAAGNQIKRELCVNCTAARTSKPDDTVPVKEEEKKEEDFVKAFPEDVISYYPNPVLEDLYLKWDLINDNKVTQIQLYSAAGQHIKTFPNLEKETTQTISFQRYAHGTYVVLFLYSNGDQKSIQIIKQ